MNSARVDLSIILRRASPDIIRALAEEAARSITVDGSTSGANVNDYEAWMNTRMRGALDAVAADDDQRARTLMSLAAADPGASVRPIPLLARVGLLSIGLRLARAQTERATVGQADAAEIMREFDLLDAALRSSYAAFAARR